MVNVDIQHKTHLYTSNINLEIDRCRREFARNRCNSVSGQRRIPALENMCAKWQACMDQDPAHVGTGRIAAETFADIVNGFFVHTTWKALVFLSCIVVGCVVLSNVAFGSYRRLYVPRRPVYERIEMEETARIE